MDDNITPFRISEMLKEKNIQRKDFQKDLGFPKNAVSEWESGFTKSYRKKLPEIAKYLGVSIEYLLGETDEKEKPATVNIGDGLSEKKIQLINQIRDADDDTVDLLFQIADRIMHDRPEE